MQKNVLLSTFILSALVLVLPSCMTNSYPQLASRVHHKSQEAPKSIAVAKRNVRKEENVYALSKIPEQQAVLTSVMIQPRVAIPQNFLPTYTASANEKRIRIAVSEKSEIKTAKIVTAINSKALMNRTAYNSSRRTGDQLLCAIVSIFIPFLGVALYEDGITVHFWIDLILSLIFWIPGIIYALIIILAE